MQFDMIEPKSIQLSTMESGQQCYVFRDTIAEYDLGGSIQFYKYDKEQNKVVPIQDLIPVGYAWAMDFSPRMLILWNGCSMVLPPSIKIYQTLIPRA